jgi:hypothetical protein
MPSVGTEQEKEQPAGIPIMGGPTMEPKYAYLDGGIYYIPLWSGKLHRRGVDRQSARRPVMQEEYYPDIILVAVSDGVQSGKGLRDALAAGAKPLSDCPREGINCTELDKHQKALDDLMRQQIDAHRRKLQMVQDGILEARRVKLSTSQQDLFNWWLGQSAAT